MRGATRRQLIAQFLSEALLTALIALVLALAFVEILLPLIASSWIGGLNSTTQLMLCSPA